LSILQQAQDALGATIGALLSEAEHRNDLPGFCRSLEHARLTLASTITSVERDSHGQKIKEQLQPRKVFRNLLRISQRGASLRAETRN
jgi:hypothetical protein